MGTSPKAMANIYFIMGVLFVYMATRSAGETVWNSTTMLLAIFATLDFGIALRLMRNHVRNNKNKE
ncbi:YdiK family protein [Virgibacillus necropolis]|uniref:YdiK family protein n=1 Tax=Virgibacillus necropolis TaxID=163877 RepID=UPI0038511716